MRVPAAEGDVRSFFQRLKHAYFPPDFNYRPETPAGIAKKLAKVPLTEHYTVTPFLQAVWIFIGVFAGIAAIGAIDFYGTRPEGFPFLFAALGASATIMFYAPGAPYTQPYHMLVGHTVPPAIAVSCQKILPSLPWLAAALSAGLSISVMSLLGAVNPPGGALAVLYPVTPSLHVLGYLYIPAALLGITILATVGFVVNNLQRQLHFPHQWF